MKYVASPTGRAFLRDNHFIKGIMGPVGSGKSTVCLMDLLARAQAQEPFHGLRRTKFALLRNTAAQLKATVKPMIDEWLVTIPLESQGRAVGQWRITDNTFEITGTLQDGTRMHSELCLMAADTPDDVRRLLSLQLSGAFVEEAREIDEDVFKGLLGRVDRFPNTTAGGVTYPGVVFATNPPPLDTFWHKLITDPPSNAAIFIQPPAVLDDLTVNPEAENLVYLSEEYYPNLIAANSEEWVDVYLRNKFGLGNAGQAVYRSTFRRKFHVAESGLSAVPGGAPLIVGMDNGLQAAAVVMQQDPRGRVNALSCCFVPENESMGVETFLDRLLVPHLLAKYPVRRDAFLFVLDPACFHRSQVNEATIAQAVQARGFKAVKASTEDPELRQAAMEGLLTRQIDGKAGMLFDPNECHHLIEGMEWGYRFRKTTVGQTTSQREKNHFSHTCEAAEYAALHFNAQFSQTMSAFQSKVKEIKPRNYAYI